MSTALRLQAQKLLRIPAKSNADIFCCQEIKIRCPLSAPGRLWFWNPAKRPGDAGASWLDVAKAEELLAWKAVKSLEDMCRDSWRWQINNPEGYAG